MTKLGSLSSGFFSGQSQLNEIKFTGSSKLGAVQRLPGGVFKGLTSLVVLDLGECEYKKLPNMSDLTVRALFLLSCVRYNA